MAVAAEEELAARAGRPLAGRDHQPPRRRRPPPLRPARSDLTARLDERAALRLSQHLRRPAAPVPRPGRRHRRALAQEAEPELEKLVRSGYRTVVAWDRRGEAERAAYNLARVRGRASSTAARIAREPGVCFAAGVAARGLHRAAAEARDPARAPAAAPPPRRAPGGPAPGGGGALAAFTDLRAGDVVVHEDHGIGRFTGFDTKTVGGITRDYLELEYPRRRPRLRADRPAPQDQPLRRRRAPATRRCRKLGGKAWEQHEVARPPRRAGAGGRADQPLRRAQAPRRPRLPAGRRVAARVRARFPYRETPDQLEAIEAVKADMEEARPMDRLICGDVGYGKTEVALRAAFKAAADGKQVMFLVPTTILAQQHFGTFTERLRDYPFTIELVSRFRSRGGAARGARGLRRGQGRHPDRHPPAALARRAPEGPRPADRRRGAALRRQAEGAAAPAAAERRRAVAVAPRRSRARCRCRSPACATSR